MPENEVIDVDALFNEAFPVEPAEADAAPAPTPEAAPTSAEEGSPETAPAPAPTPARVPPSDDTHDSETAKPADKAEESRLAKIENDLALAKKAQAAADRKNAELERQNRALNEARMLEQQRIQQLIVEGRLTTEDVAAGPQRMEAYVAYREAEAAQEAAQAAQLAEQAQADTARAEREAELYFKEQAIPLLSERIALGLSDDVNTESLLRAALATPDREADIALTWRISDPVEQARITKRVMDGAIADAKAELAKLAAAKAATEEKKVARSQYDRTTAVGPATGGRDQLPTFTSVDDDLANYYAQQAAG